MPIKYLPYFPNTIEGQAILDNFTRTRRVLRHRDNGKVYDRITRGMPLYEVEKLENVNGGSDNLVIRGECLSACAYLKEQGITVDLVYIDPPFASGADYAKKVYLRRNPDKAAEIAEKTENCEDIATDDLKAFEEKMYGDIWNKEDYLNWMFENLHAIKSVMSDTASIYVHLDWHIGHYVKVLLDEVFGESNYRNHIVWAYFGFKRANSRRFPQKHDDIFYYVKDVDNFVWNTQFRPHSDEYKARFKPDATGRMYRDDVNPTGGGARIIYLDQVEGDIIESFWDDIPPVNPVAAERADYNTQKPEALLERIVKASSREGMVIADFFGGSGVAAKVANKLGRRFIHVDVGLNSLQTTRDRLLESGAIFSVMDIRDGVSLFRNPIQTMDKLKSQISALRNEDKLDKFWEGAIQDSKLGLIPVYLPNLLDHSTKILDIALMNRVLNEAMPDLSEDVRKVVVYYVDIVDEKAVRDFIKEQNVTDVEIELRDLKQLLTEFVTNDFAEYELLKTEAGYEVEFTRFVSDRVQQKIDEYNQKKGSQRNGNTLFDEADENGELVEFGEEPDEEKPKKKAKFKPIEISENGLELIEYVSLDCTNADIDAVWQSDSEIKIDRKSYVIHNGAKTKEFWDAKIQSEKKPLRMKVRNIAGDESIFDLVTPKRN